MFIEKYLHRFEPMNRKYPIGYKPNVCLASFTVKYFNKKHEAKIRSDRKDIQKKAIEEHVKSFFVNIYPLVLDDKLEHPTEKLKQKDLKAVWKFMNIKDKFEEQVIVLRDIKVQSSSKINYEFDELIH